MRQTGDESTTDADAPVFLVGFMGAGKTTIGCLLAQKLNYKFLDLDDVIEQRAARKISEIFAEAGEAEFRRLESEALSSCARARKTVIALGGGAFTSEQNRAAISKAGKTVWLDCPLDLCLERISGDDSRPLAKEAGEARALYEARRAAYAQADFVLQTGEDSAESIADRIADKLTANRANSR